MKVILQSDGLLVEPETSFEVQYLRRFACGNPVAFLKHGVSISTVIGLKVKFPVEDKPKGKVK